MNSLHRAFLYVTRKKGKTFLLFTILFIMATSVLSGLSIWKASDQAQLNLRQSLGGSFDIAVDWSDNNPYMVKKTVVGPQHDDNAKQSLNYVMYSSKQLSPEDIEDLKKLKGVKYCNAYTEVLSKFEDISLFPGTIPIAESYQKQTKLMGAWTTQDNDLFTSNTLTLIEGQHILPNDDGKAIISQDLASRNGLKIGDFLKTKSMTGKEIKIQIIGILQHLKLRISMKWLLVMIKSRIVFSLI